MRVQGFHAPAQMLGSSHPPRRQGCAHHTALCCGQPQHSWLLAAASVQCTTLKQNQGNSSQTKHFSCILKSVARALCFFLSNPALQLGAASTAGPQRHPPGARLEPPRPWLPGPALLPLHHRQVGFCFLSPASLHRGGLALREAAGCRGCAGLLGTEAGRLGAGWSSQPAPISC